MKRLLCLLCGVICLGMPIFVFAAETVPSAPAVVTEVQIIKPRIVLLITEQNIEGPRSAWWASEVDLSATEAALAGKLLEAGFDIVQPSGLQDVVKKEKAFRMVDIGDKDSTKLGTLGNADFVITGKAVASAGGNVPQSSMRSCFANVTAKLIEVRTGRILAYVDASGNSAHSDVITGGREALVMAAGNITPKIIDVLRKVPVSAAVVPVVEKNAQSK
jgi:hypothetical protein